LLQDRVKWRYFLNAILKLPFFLIAGNFTESVVSAFTVSVDSDRHYTFELADDGIYMPSSASSKVYMLEGRTITLVLPQLV